MENYRNFEWRTPRHIWHALIGEVFLQRTRAQNVVPVYLTFIARFPEAEDLKTATLEEIEELIYPLGLKWRAPLLFRLCEELARTGGRVPTDAAALMALPGVGPYVAAAMLSFHTGKRGVIIDANVVRWLCRMVYRPMNGETRRDRWLIDLAESVTPARDVGSFNYALLDFTMEICTKTPKCERCPLLDLCAYGQQRKNIPDPAPQLKSP